MLALFGFTSFPVVFLPRWGMHWPRHLLQAGGIVIPSTYWLHHWKMDHLSLIVGDAHLLRAEWADLIERWMVLTTTEKNDLVNFKFLESTEAESSVVESIEERRLEARTTFATREARNHGSSIHTILFFHSSSSFIIYSCRCFDFAILSRLPSSILKCYILLKVGLTENCYDV